MSSYLGLQLQLPETTDLLLVRGWWSSLRAAELSSGRWSVKE